MVEERGVPVHEDWSIAPDEDKVRFSLSGVTPHSCKNKPGTKIYLFKKLYYFLYDVLE